MGDYENSSQAEWNADAIQLSVIFTIKLDVAKHLDSWDLEKAYWSNRAFRRELDAVLTRKKKKIQEDFEKEHDREVALEKGEIDIMINALTDGREEWSECKDDEKAKLKFFMLNEEFYMHLCFIMKKHGLYLRESNDAGFAMARR